MKKWLKIFLVVIGVLFVVSFIWFDWFFWQGNNRLFESNLTEAGKTSDVIIIFNSGGYGTVHLEKAYDFQPLIKGIQNTIAEKGHTSAVVPYYRTEDSILGKAAYFKEIIFGFPKESSYLAKKLQDFSKVNPGKKIIITGLSNGAGLVEMTMKKITCCQTDFSAIEFGLPFWIGKQDKTNIIYFNNKGEDTFSRGNVPILLWAGIKAPFVMVYSSVIGKPISFPEAMNVPGHNYLWSEIEPQVRPFLDAVLVFNQYQS